MRIASLQPSITLTLAALGRLDTLCAATKYCREALPTFPDIPILKDAWSADTAELESLKPDLILACVPYRLEALAAMLKAGLPVLTLAPHSLADIFADIRLIASIVHADPEPVIIHFERTLAQTRALTVSLPRPLVHCEEWGNPIIHSQPWVAELIEAAGGNVLGTPGTHTTSEAVAASNPEVLLFSWCGAGNRVPLSRVVEQRAWQTLPAVEQRQVFCIPDLLLNTPAPTLLRGLAAIAHAFHPAIFPPQPGVVQL